MKHLSRPFSRLLGLSGLAALLLGGGPLLPLHSAQAASSNLTASTAVDAQARVIVRFKSTAASVRAKALSASSDTATVQSVAQTRVTALAQRTGLSSALAAGLTARRSLDERTHVVTASGMSSAALVAKLALDSEVELVAEDHLRRHTTVTPNDTLYAGNGGVAPVSGNGSANGQWYLKTPTSAVVSSIDAPAAWGITTGVPTVVVAVLDTGIRFDHPDLAGQFISNSAFASGYVGADMVGWQSGDSYGLAMANKSAFTPTDATDPGDWVSQADITAGTLGSGCTSSDIGDSSWHGTRTAGLIAAASNNSAGISGTAWGVKLVPVRVLGKCGGYDSDIIAGMKWAVGIAVSGLPTNPNPAKVLNMSLGGTGTCSTSNSTGQLYLDAISQVTAKGASIVAAAGNSEGTAVGIPGNCAGVIAVAALRHVGTKVGFSSLGPEVTIAAPGGNCVNSTGACLYTMLSTTNSGTTTPVAADAAYTNNTDSVGTSFSAPITAGTVALMFSANSNLTPAQVQTLVKSSARSFVTSGGTAGIAQCHAPTSTVQDECYCTTSTCGAGMLDAGAAVTAAQNANTATTAQTITFAALGSQTLNNSPLTLSATASSSLAVTYTASPPSVCTVSGTSLTLVAVGTCAVTAHQAGNTVYVAATPVTQSFAVSQATQTITFTSPGAQTLGTTPAALVASASSGLAVSLSSSTAAVCTVSGTTLTLVSAGTCTLTATQAGNTSYAAATPVTVTVTVSAAPASSKGGGAAGGVWVALLGLAAFVLRRGRGMAV
ncbi:S8 family serine peptidase [Roseateles koreensis]|uniref:S8 family serine peptidase n=1 Tax=Roseateles koreensis TaxID=2987526 RepID=A0ABT5KWB1_9BURK|nr:S8 family serine peptidase [Roseateles koreensis]MDC8787226.1 S8 family serine peptidase [Roseateles koreensis]